MTEVRELLFDDLLSTATLYACRMVQHVVLYRVTLDYVPASRSRLPSAQTSNRSTRFGTVSEVSKYSPDAGDAFQSELVSRTITWTSDLIPW